MQKKWKQVGASLAALLMLSYGGYTFAADEVSLKIQPTLIEEKVTPGQVFEKTVTLTNYSTAPQALYLSTKDISDVTENGTPVFAKEGEKTPYDISSWVTFTQESFKLNPGETKFIPIKISVPSEVSPGGHYGGVFFTQNPPEVKQSGTGVGYELGTLLNLRVSGEINEAAQIREFVTDKMIYGKSNTVFTAKVENIGNVLVRPRGPIDITNMFGKKVDTVRMNDAAAAVFPKATRTFTAAWDNQDLHFGRYQAVMSLVYGETGNQTITRVTDFWVLPANIIIPVAGFLLLFILITWILMRLYVARRLKQLSGYSARTGGDTSLKGMSRLTAVTIALLMSVIIVFIILFVFF